MSYYIPQLTKKILKIIKNSDIIDPTLITTLDDLKKINITFYFFIYNLIYFYDENMNIFEYPKDKTFDSLLNHIITKSNIHFNYFGFINKYSVNKIYSDTTIKTIIQSMGLELISYNLHKPFKVYLLFYYQTFLEIINLNNINLKTQLYNFNLLFKNKSIYKGLKFFILIRYLKTLFSELLKPQKINIPKIIIIFDFFLEYDY